MTLNTLISFETVSMGTKAIGFRNVITTKQTKHKRAPYYVPDAILSQGIRNTALMLSPAVATVRIYFISPHRPFSEDAHFVSHSWSYLSFVGDSYLFWLGVCRVPHD